MILRPETRIAYADVLESVRVYEPRPIGGPLFFDNFDDPDVSLDVHVPDISVGANLWLEQAGDWKCHPTDPWAICFGATPPAGLWRAVYDVGVADFVMEGRIYNSGPNDGVGLLFRYSDALNYWYAWGRHSPENKIYLTKIEAGVPTHWVHNFSVPLSQWHTYKVTCVDEAITFLFTRETGEQDSIVLAGQAFNKAATRIGLWTYETNPNPPRRWESVTVTV